MTWVYLWPYSRITKESKQKICLRLKICYHQLQWYLAWPWIKYHLNYNELYMSACKYWTQYRWSWYRGNGLEMFFNMKRSCSSGAEVWNPMYSSLIPCIPMLSLKHSKTLLPPQWSLRQSALCPTSCGLQYSDFGFIQDKSIVLSKGILIIRQSDEHCTSVKDLSEYVRIVDG